MTKSFCLLVPLLLLNLSLAGINTFRMLITWTVVCVQHLKAVGEVWFDFEQLISNGGRLRLDPDIILYF